MFRLQRLHHSRKLFQKQFSTTQNNLPPVAIVGHGPVGVYLSTLLSTYKVPNFIIEAGDGQVQTEGAINDPKLHPRAHVLHTRSMEMMRAIGAEEAILGLSPPTEQWSHFRYCTKILGKDSTLASVNHFDSDEYRKLRKASPSRLTHLSQPLLESVLISTAAAARNNTESQVLFKHRFKAIEPNDSANHLSIKLASSESGDVEPKVVSCSYLVGADGAHGSVRRSVDVPLVGDFNLESFMSVHFTSFDLSEKILQEGVPAMLSFAFSEDVIGVLVAHDLRKGVFVAHIAFFPPVQEASDFDEETCRHLLSSIIGIPLQSNNPGSIQLPNSIPWKFHAAKPWGMHASCAKTFSVMNNKVLLAGDAAHQFPPSGGFGVNTGFGDVQNLAWKLALVYHQEADPSLLDTYNVERLSTVQEAIRLAIDNYRRGLLPAQALGLDRMLMTVGIDALSKSPFQALLAGNPAKQALKTAFSWASKISNGPGVDGRRKVLKHLTVDQRLCLPMFFPEFDLGYSVATNCSNDHYHDKYSSPLFGGLHKTQVDYIPRLKVGHLLPHGWMKVLDEAGNVASSKRVSTIDLVDRSKQITDMVIEDDKGYLPRFTLFIPGNQLVKGTIEQVARVAASTLTHGAPWRIVVVFTDSVDPNWKQNTQSMFKLDQLESVVGLVDQEEKWMSPTRWGNGYPVVLVRPDGHIAWRIFV